MILVIYVDDLLLAGPEGKHEKFWARLGKDVSIEEPEALERYLGRHHVITVCERDTDDLMRSFDSTAADA